VVIRPPKHYSKGSYDLALDSAFFSQERKKAEMKSLIIIMVSKPRKVKINRLWHGDASIRDYLVEWAIQEKRDLQIILKNSDKWMIIPWQDLDKGRRNPEKFRSKHDSRIYSLIDFRWKPDESQKSLFDDPETFSKLVL